jgi:two-component system, OmpR family, alkaline phosphatase synthesis response regulator PhoP
MAQKKVLTVDDEIKVCEILKAYLEKDGYEVIVATDGKSAVEIAQRTSPDLILLDLNLPEINGLDVCRLIRSRSNVPIIMLTARDEETDKIIGLEIGADDYITKPFSPREVVARVRAVLRRHEDGRSTDETVTLGDLVIDLAQHKISYAGKQLPLTSAEFKLLAVLARNPGRVYTRLQLMDAAFSETYEGYERTIDAHIKNIRQKMLSLAPEHSDFLITIRGVGYKLEKL